MPEIIDGALAGLTILCAGLLKGVLGIGAPLVAVPILAAIYDVPTAIAVMTFPLVVSSLAQAWSFRKADFDRTTLIQLLGGCALGAVLGTLLLGVLSTAWLSIALAAFVFAYVALHLARPDLAISARTACRVAAPVGLLIGVMQGAAGVSTPLSVTFMLAQNLARGPYLLVTQSMFVTLGLTQILALSAVGIMTFDLVSASLVAILPMLAGLWIGNYVGDHVSRATFERLTLVVISLIAVSLVVKAVPRIMT
jgi:uncharacterized membrane protein YfcA